MKKLPLILSVGSVALLLGGCPSSDTTNQSQPITQESPTPPPSPPPSATAPPAFSDRPPAIASTTVAGGAGLVPSTDPDEKRKAIAREKGREDPTKLFYVEPKINIKVGEEKVQVNVKPGKPAKPSPRIARLPRLPRSVYPPAISSPPLPPPRPTEAEGVQVSGIVQLPTTPMAIVKAPDEGTERRVYPGDTLSNGRILVLAIETDQRNPRILLVQDGQLVIRKLGAGTPATATSPEATPTQSAMIYPESGAGGSR